MSEDERSSILLLDGGMGSELERRGVDISLPLWAARALIDATDAVRDVHLDYLRAGATAILTNTFRTHRRSLAKEGLGDQAEALTQTAVEIALGSREASGVDAMILGSVAPLEDCYRPDEAPDGEVCRREHEELIRTLIAGGVDLIWLETMCSAVESSAAVDAARECAPEKWGISFCLSATEPGQLLDGTPIEALAHDLADAQFVGINCVAAHLLAQHVRHVRTVFGASMRIAAYGNVGYADADGGWVSTDAVAPSRFADYAMSWVDAGASMIGGCCGTSPATIAAMRDRLNLPSQT